MGDGRDCRDPQSHSGNNSAVGTTVDGSNRNSGDGGNTIAVNPMEEPAECPGDPHL